MDPQHSEGGSFTVARALLTLPAVLTALIGLIAILVGISAIPSDPAPGATKADLDRWLYWPDVAIGSSLLLLSVAGVLWAYGGGRRRHVSRLIGLAPANLCMLAMIILGNLHML